MPTSSAGSGWTTRSSSSGPGRRPTRSPRRGRPRRARAAGRGHPRMTDVAVVATGDQTLYLGLYRRMLLIRGFEELVQSLFVKGLVHGTTHLCSGQEATEVGVASMLREGDR